MPVLKQADRLEVMAVRYFVYMEFTIHRAGLVWSLWVAHTLF